jgi:hypothetical protein
VQPEGLRKLKKKHLLHRVSNTPPTLQSVRNYVKEHGNKLKKIYAWAKETCKELSAAALTEYTLIV